MLSMAPKFLKDCITGLDGETYDIGRVLWGAAFLTGVLLEVFSVVTGRSFDLQQYGLGVGALLVAGGAAIGLKKDTEPK